MIISLRLFRLAIHQPSHGPGWTVSWSPYSSSGTYARSSVPAGWLCVTFTRRVLSPYFESVSFAPDVSSVVSTLRIRRARLTIKSGSRAKSVAPERRCVADNRKKSTPAIYRAPFRRSYRYRGTRSLCGPLASPKPKPFRSS